MKTIFIDSELKLGELKSSATFFDTGCIVALGFFDGVHTAHRNLIKKARKIADSESLPLVIFTFSAKSARLKSSRPRLYSDSEKLFIFEQLGVDYTLVADFSVFKDMSAKRFAEGFLVNILNTHTAVCGFNFKFGRGADTGAEGLRRILLSSNRRTVVLPEISASGKTVSSTYIRELIEKRKIREATALLGAPYFISGRVGHGLGLGKSLGIPTVNIPLGEKKTLIPSGVYFTLAVIDSEMHFCITNVGKCPTVSERETHTETLILDFNRDIYDVDLKIYFIDFLRDEKKFSSTEELIMQINIDKKRVYELAKEIKCQDIGLSLQ